MTIKILKSLALVPCLALLIGCNTTTKERTSMGVAAPVAKATPDQEAALLGRIKALEGKWAMKDEPGKHAITFDVSSGGHVVREIMFPGAEHEMTNLYHMDGSSLVMTHYCAVGNQPRMRAAAAGKKDIVFTFDSVTNLTAADQSCMREMTIEFIDDNTIAEHWRSYVGDKQVHGADFTLTRMK